MFYMRYKWGIAQQCWMRLTVDHVMEHMVWNSERIEKDVS